MAIEVSLGGQVMFSAPAGAARVADAQMYFYSRGMLWRLGHRIEVLEDSLSGCLEHDEVVV
ncbi:hypothetical protein WME73_46985 [Sorangium sp. So ce302]|uniref:hypothetical protein n=1 Tax=Sorangium sp. So ce302 TaxID=3133297 RepID=UPI003F6424DC